MLAANGEKIAPVDAAIFADTGAEPTAVMEWLDYLELLVAKSPHPFPIYRVMVREGLTKDLENGVEGGRCASPPLYVKRPDGKREGMLWRQCTREYKVRPIQRKIRELLGLKPRQRIPKGLPVVEQLIGISTDEMQR